jgi:hypothetical protein
VQFGKPWFLGTRVDRYSQPVPHYGGYYSWLTTWAVDQEVNPRAAWCFYDPSCGPNIQAYPPEAFDSDAERAEVDRLLALRRKEQFSERVSDGFAALTWQRRLHHPLDNLIVLPARRAWNVWINDHADIRHNRVPWPAVFEPMRNQWTKVAKIFCALTLLSSLLLIWRRETRRIAAMLAAAIVLRTLFLAYFFYVEPRYTVEVMPLGLCLIAGALVLAAQKLGRPRAA